MKLHIIYGIILVFLASTVAAQDVTNTSSSDTSAVVTSKNNSPHSYNTDIDQYLNLRSVTVAPTYDNVDGIYKGPTEKKLQELMTQDSFWSLTEFKPLADEDLKNYRIDWFEDQPEYTQKVIDNSRAESLVRAVITKSTSGLTVKLNLFLKDGSLLLSVSHQDKDAFEISKLNEIIEMLYKNLKQKLPYQGLVMSRTGNNVTVNLGKKSGVKVNDKVSVAHIIGIKRHPKLKFMTGFEKAIIGQITINKIDNEMSFGQINFEREFGVIQKGGKILPVNFVKYTADNVDDNGEPILTGDEKAVEWVPTPEPQFGKISAAVGISDFKISAMNKAGTSSYGTSNSMIPSFKLGAELWITSEWFASFDMKQSFFKASNGLAGSNPESLSFVNSKYDILYGYRYSVTGNFWGPQLSVGAGYVISTTRVTDSAPVAYTSTEASGVQLQVGGYFPTTADYKTAVGGKAKFILFSNYSETPVSSGKPNTSINAMSVYLTHQISTRLQIKPEIEYTMINTSFSGAGSNPNGLRSSEEKMMSYLFGIEYLF